MAVRQILSELVKVGVDVQVLGATIFDHERGAAGLLGHWEAIKAKAGKFVIVTDDTLHHKLLVTASTQYNQMTSQEEFRWFQFYENTLNTFKPDFVFYYGGGMLDLLLSAEARYRGIPVGFYLANGNYHGNRWYRDIDLILTDSQATADLYRDRSEIAVTPVGAFIDPNGFVAPKHTRERLLFVNPTLEKGAGIVARLALIMEKRRPDITFEVVESRGSWSEIVRAVTAGTGAPRESLSNVVVTTHTVDMRPLYARARLLLAPSLCWESSGRVLAEAMLNGIPAIITGSGGMPEMVGDACLKLKLPEQFHEKPYVKIPTEETLEPLVQHIEALYDDQKLYAEFVRRAERVGRERHSLKTSTMRLMNALAPWLNQRAGDHSTDAHRVGKPDVSKADASSIGSIKTAV